MFKLLFKKTVFRGADKESQERLLKQLTKKYSISVLTFLIWPFLFIVPVLLLIVIDFLEKGEFSARTQLTVAVYVVVDLAIFLILLKYFFEDIVRFSTMIGNKIYFKFYTSKGKAISKEDFEKIKKESEDLFFFIESGLCKGFCYAICFDILKVLKKGKIEFAAVKEIKYIDEQQETNYTLHVFYMNSGWAFDTYSVRQYPIDEIHRINTAIVCRSFSFEDVKDLDYDEFWRRNHDDVSEWCKRNKCSENWSKKEDDEKKKKIA